ncbi:hypothetical protein D3C87_2185750 [compost metagenome]
MPRKLLVTIIIAEAPVFQMKSMVFASEEFVEFLLMLFAIQHLRRAEALQHFVNIGRIAL